MRTITTLQRNAISAATINVYHKLEVTGPDDVPTGTRQWFDVSSNLPNTTIDFLNSATLSENIDGNCMSFQAILLRESGTKSLAPLMTGSTVNRNNAATYAPILDVGRQWRLSVAIPTTVGAAPVAGDWKVMGIGKIDSIDTGSSTSTITITGRDLGAYIIDAYISNNTTVYSPGNNQSLEQVIQSLLDNTLGSGVVTLYTPVASSVVIPGFTQNYGGLMEAITSLAAKFGWAVRYFFDSSDNFQFTLMKPNRAASTPNWIIGPNEYLSVPQNLLDLSGVRNYIELRYIDSTAGLTTVISPSSGTSASITKYGKRYMGVDQQNGSQINTAASAQAMADAIRSDIELPNLQQQVMSYGFWFAQLYDYGQFLANGVHYDTDQYGAVRSISHSISGGTLKTTIGASGKPAGRYRVYGALGADFVAGIDFPSLGVQITPYSDHYVLTYSGAGVTYSKDGAAYIAAPASPWNISRDASTHQFSLQIIRPSGTITDTFTLPSLGADMVTPNIAVTPGTMSATTQQYVPTASNPAADGRALTLSITLHGGLSATGSTTGSITTNDSPITIASGETITITRAAFGSNPCNVTFTASLSGGGAQSIQRSVPNQDKATFGPSLTLSVTPGTGSYSIGYAAGGNSYVLTYTTNGGTTWSTPGASPVVVTRNSAGGADIVVTFRNVADGQTVTDSVTVPAIGSTGVATPDLQVTPGTMTTTTSPFVVTATDPTGTNTPVITVTIRNGLGGTAGTGPGGSMTDGTGYTMASGSTVTVSRSPFASGPCSITFRATLPAGGAAEIQRSVTNQDKLAFGPNLVVTPTPGPSSYSIVWSGDGVQLSIDGGTYATPGASPIVVTRNAAGGADKNYTFTGLKDSQTTSNTVVIPAQSGSTAPSNSIAATLTNNQVDDTVNPVTVTAGGINLPGTYTYAIYQGFSAGQWNAAASYTGSNSTSPLSGPFTFNVTPGPKLSKWFKLVITVGSDTYVQITQVQGMASFINSSGAPVRGTAWSDGGGAATTTDAAGSTLAGAVKDTRGSAVNTLFRNGTDTTSSVVPTASESFINASYIDGSYRPTSVYRSTVNEPVGNLFKNADSADNVTASANHSFLTSSYIDGSNRPISVYRGSTNTAVTNLFQNADSADNVTASTNHSFLTSSYIDGSNRPISIYRGSTNEPATNLFKNADSADNVTASSNHSFLASSYIDGSNRPVSVYRASTITSVDNLAQINSSAIYPSQFVAGYVDVVLSFRNSSSNPTGTFAGKQGDISYTGSGLWIREAGFATGSGATRPSLGFHWGGIIASQIAMISDGSFEFRDQPGTGFRNIYAAAGIFTGYLNSPKGMVGQYSSGYRSLIYAIGSAYQGTSDANGFMTSIANAYGIFRTYDNTIGVTGRSMGDGIEFIGAGTPHAFISAQGIWSNATAYCNDFVLN